LNFFFGGGAQGTRNFTGGRGPPAPLGTARASVVHTDGTSINNYKDHVVNDRTYLVTDQQSIGIARSSVIIYPP